MIPKYKVTYETDPHRQQPVQSFMTDDPVALDDFLVEILDRKFRLREILREELGGTYGVSVGFSNNPPIKGYGAMQIQFGSSPENVDKLVNAALKELERLKAEGPSADDVAKVKEGKWTFTGTLSHNPPAVRNKFGGRWLTTEYQAGDFLTFGMFQVHASLDNRTENRLRISSDTRYQRASEPIDERWIGVNKAAPVLERFLDAELKRRIKDEMVIGFSTIDAERAQTPDQLVDGVGRPITGHAAVENIDKVRLENENRRLKNALKRRFKPANIIGHSKPMQEVYGLIGKVASARTTVLILGESGVGKELVANAIHYHSPSAEGPFVKVNCAALPESLAESELFGHEKGSFTGALGMRKGRFEMADGGTIFLDEVGELPLAAQAKLLRVLEAGEVQRVGSLEARKVDVRVIAATHQNLEKLIAEGRFREDLFFRLNVFNIRLPALRERPRDIPLVADHFIKKYAEANGLAVRRLSEGALALLMAHHWRGNVRELENTMHRAVLLARGATIEPEAIMLSSQMLAPEGSPPPVPAKPLRA